MIDTSALQHVTTFCGQCSCGCPELYIDPTAPEERRVVITDDFGAHIAMSRDQLADLVAQVRDGRVDAILTAPA